MALGFAKHTGRLGVCSDTTGPGAVHMLNGLYDASFDGAPVVALTGLTFHDLSGVHYQQGLDTTKLKQDVAFYNVEVTGLEHGPAIRSAFASRKAALVEAWVDADENPVKPDELTA
jgi:pyruvate dehydrogenase (quinone)/pyruvate decarboxylase